MKKRIGCFIISIYLAIPLYSQNTFEVKEFPALEECMTKIKTLANENNIQGECSCFLNDYTRFYVDYYGSERDNDFERPNFSNIKSVSLELFGKYYNESLKQLEFYDSLKYILVTPNVYNENKDLFNDLLRWHPELVMDTLNAIDQSQKTSKYIESYRLKFFNEKNVYASNYYFNDPFQTHLSIDFCDTCDTKILDSLFKQFEKIISLEITGHHLEKFPDKLNTLHHLKYLKINGSAKKLPESLGQIESLEKLTIVNAFTNENIDSLPHSLKGLKKLFYFYYDGVGKEIFIPKDFIELNNLNSLELNNFKKLNLPDLSLFLNLKRLEISNGIVPKINAISSLKELYLYNIKGNVKGLVTSENLQMLTLCKINIKNFSMSIFGLKDLTMLSIRNIPLKELPKDIIRNEKLYHLEIIDADIKEIPNEFFKNITMGYSIRIDIPKVENLNQLFPPTFDDTQLRNDCIIQILKANSLKSLPTWFGQYNGSFMVESSSIKDLSNIKIKDDNDISLKFSENYIPAISSLPDGKYNLYITIPESCLKTFNAESFIRLKQLNVLSISFEKSKKARTWEESDNIFKYTNILKKKLPNTSVYIN